MVAYQLAFDIFEDGNQNFLASLLNELEQRGLVTQTSSQSSPQQ